MFVVPMEKAWQDYSKPIYYLKAPKIDFFLNKATLCSEPHSLSQLNYIAHFIF